MKGFNHVTIRVSDLTASLAFYCGILGMELVHQGRTDAYLEWGAAWICLLERKQLQPMPGEEAYGVDHVALSIENSGFDAAVERLKQAAVPIVRGPIERGGGRVVNFLDPDGTQLEWNTGSLAGRMKVWN
ncbi:VOC family protein [Paenibacillus thalictri]|uniref:Glutathione transferase n=1 Tax=Paenibacillus thalictri TaxID=2527873 RepID=A0A4Q9DWR9_9BACL|nr:VOC family protein [Paenibacillus thalictri]TBL80197.1 glutathione transferase [Paenibacillus thalictri]